MNLNKPCLWDENNDLNLEEVVQHPNPVFLQFWVNDWDAEAWAIKQETRIYLFHSKAHLMTDFILRKQNESYAIQCRVKYEIKDETII